MEWLPDERYNKYRGIYKLQHNPIFDPFRMYGQDIYIAGAIEECVKLGEAFCMTIRGKDKPISIAYVRDKIKRGEL